MEAPQQLARPRARRHSSSPERELVDWLGWGGQAAGGPRSAPGAGADPTSDPTEQAPRAVSPRGRPRRPGAGRGGGVRNTDVEVEGELVQTHTHGLQRVHLVSPSLDEHLRINDTKTGRQLAGVGIFVHQEEGENIYVSKILPSGAAAMCGMIQIDDELISIDEHVIRPDDELTKVRPAHLAPRYANAAPTRLRDEPCPRCVGPAGSPR